MQFSESICIIYVDVDHYKNILDYLLGVLSIGKINPIFFFATIKPTIFAIYFDTLGVRDMQFLELICKSYIDMDHLGTNLDQFLWVPRIAEISPRFFEDN